MDMKTHTKIFPRIRRDERGQSMTEFVLVLPALLLVLFAIVQFGILFNNFVTLTDGVRAGARVAAVSRLAPDPVGDTIAKVKASAPDLDPGKIDVKVGPTPLEHGNDVSVTGTYPYSIKILGVELASGNLSSKTTERVE